MKTEPYRPSNGTEGEIFMSRFCFQCERDKDLNDGRDPEYGIGCPILADTLCYDISDPKYPKEWIRDSGAEPIYAGAKSGPRCTAFVPLGGEVPYRCDRTEDMFGGE